MESEMIIYCKATNLWIRARDYLLYSLSLLLWAALLSTMLRMKPGEILLFFSSFYLVMLFLVTGLIFGWSRYRKSIFRIITRDRNRRMRYPVLAPCMTAKYLFIEEDQLRALQMKKGTIIQHSNEGQISSLVFHNHTFLHCVSFKERIARYYAAA